MLSLEMPQYVAHRKQCWAAAQPLSMIVIEYFGDGDPAFGGSADDRALGPAGVILDRQDRMHTQPVSFSCIDDAHVAAKAIKNRRANTILGVAPIWR